MKENLDKIIPIIIAIVLVFINYKKKNKKPVQITKPQPAESSATVEKTGDSDIFNPFFRNIENLLNFTQPENHPVEEVEEPQKITEKQPVKLPDAEIDTKAASIKPISTEQITNVNHFEFDLRRAIIDSEIINRKYFSI